MPKVKMPKIIYVYVADYGHGDPIYAVAETIDDLPMDQPKLDVGKYELQQQQTWVVNGSFK